MSRLLAILLLIAASAIGFLGVVANIHPYAWSDDPDLVAQIDEDTPLVAAFFLMVSLILSAGSMLFARRASRVHTRMWIVGAMGVILLLVTGARLIYILVVTRGAIG